MKTSLHRPPMLACGLAPLIAAGGMLLSTSGSQAAAHRRAVLVKDIRPGRSASITNINGEDGCGCIYNGGQLTDVRGTLYFRANDGKHGFELWRSDGTARGTRMVKDINPGAQGRHPSPVTDVNGTLYFDSYGGFYSDLWRSDGTEAGTTLVKPHLASSASSTSTGPSISAGDADAGAERCGEATAPRPGRRWSKTSAPGAPSTSNKQCQRSPSTS